VLKFFLPSPKPNSLNILDFYHHYYHPNSERMKFITQGETPVIPTNNIRDIVETATSLSPFLPPLLILSLSFG